MKFKSYILTFIGVALLGASLGYVIGIYIGKMTFSESVLVDYLSVPVLSISCFIILYSVLYMKNV